MLTPEQLTVVLASVSGRAFRACRDRAMILLLLESGVRRTEASDLNVSDLDLTKRGGGTVHVRDGKNHSDRHTVVGPDAALALDRLLDKHPCNPKDGSDWDGPLFTKSNGKRLLPQSIGAVVARVGKAAGVELTDGRVLAPHMGHSGLLGAFVVADRSNGASIVFIEDVIGGRVSEDAATVAEVALRFDALRSEALPKNASRKPD